jgi:hypothetical protein
VAYRDIAVFTIYGAIPVGWCWATSGLEVIKDDIYSPKIKRAYAELAEHFAFLVDPARWRTRR